jgi:hypothetical protein
MRIGPFVAYRRFWRVYGGLRHGAEQSLLVLLRGLQEDVQLGDLLVLFTELRLLGCDLRFEDGNEILEDGDRTAACRRCRTPRRTPIAVVCRSRWHDNSPRPVRCPICFDRLPFNPLAQGRNGDPQPLRRFSDWEPAALVHRSTCRRLSYDMPLTVAPRCRILP